MRNRASPRFAEPGLATSDRSDFVLIAPDRATARYTGPGRHGLDVGTVVAEEPLEPSSLGAYFEVRVLAAAPAR